MQPCSARARTIGLTAVAMLAFAANSLLCRAALKSGTTDPATFTLIRIASGAIVLWLVLRWHRIVPEPAGSETRKVHGDWLSAAALFAYAIMFSFAYISLSAATGALLLFGTVQAAMIGVGLWRGERLRGIRLLGFALAVAGLVALLLPGVSAPPLTGALLMLGAGVSWAIYSLRGKGATDPTAVTAGNFLRAVPMSAAISLVLLTRADIDAAGVALAMLSGALASGLGYAVWYAALRGLHAIEAATVQLSVPVIAAAGSVLFLTEPLSLRLVLCAASILGGVSLVILRRSGQG